jgi:hypothetical protein
MSFYDKLATYIGSRVATQSLVLLTVSDVFSYTLGYRELLTSSEVSLWSHRRMLVQNRLQLLLHLCSSLCYSCPLTHHIKFHSEAGSHTLSSNITHSTASSIMTYVCVFLVTTERSSLPLLNFLTPFPPQLFCVRITVCDEAHSISRICDYGYTRL